MTQEQILQLIEDEDVEFIRLQFTDIFGRLKNIAVTPGQMDKVFKNRYSFSGSAAFEDRYEYFDRLFLYPNLNTFMILPWRPQQGKVAKLTCDICNEDGTPFTLSSRYVLEKVIKEAEEMGYSFLVDPECEFFLFHTDENGLPTTTTHEQAGYMDVGPVDFGENARRDIVLMLEEMGFEIESSHHEKAPAQHEIDFKEAETLKMADQIQLFRFGVRSIAKRFGLYATFMPKPTTGQAGSGMHTNIVMMKDNRNVFRSQNGGMTDEARYFMGGILKHAKAIIAITNPTVNSYKRLNAGFDAPSTICWASKGERAFINYKEGVEDTKIELRFPDGSSNPYLALAVCIAAGLDGIKNKYDCGEDAFLSKDIPNIREAIPDNLKEAIDCLAKDEVIINTLGKELADIFIGIKTNEWRDFMYEVSDWELNRYLTRI